MSEVKSTDPAINFKRQELRETNQKIVYLKKEIEYMRKQLEESYNVQKLVELED